MKLDKSGYLRCVFDHSNCTCKLQIVLTISPNFLPETYLKYLIFFECHTWTITLANFLPELSPTISQNKPQLPVLPFSCLKYHHRSSREREQIIVEVYFTKSTPDNSNIKLKNWDTSDTKLAQLVTRIHEILRMQIAKGA